MHAGVCVCVPYKHMRLRSLRHTHTLLVNECAWHVYVAACAHMLVWPHPAHAFTSQAPPFSAQFCGHCVLSNQRIKPPHFKWTPWDKNNNIKHSPPPRLHPLRSLSLLLCA